MNMKDHILAALKEQFERWDEFLESMDSNQLTLPHLPSKWSLKDEIIHLRTWQVRSIERLNAALSDREPDFPKWLPGVEPDTDANTDLINDWIYQTNHDLPWQVVHQNWREGFLQFLEQGGKIPERDLMDESRYPWMKGRPLALVLISSYDHHQEHYEKMLSWLQQNGEIKSQ
jgi:hypothetical protein